MLLFYGLLFIAVSLLAGYAIGHKDIEAFLANSASCLTLISFLYVLRLTDTVDKLRFEERRKTEVAHYCGSLKGYCEEFRTLVKDHDQSRLSIEERLGSFQGELDRLGEVLFRRERAVLFHVRVRIWVYHQKGTQRNLNAVLTEMSRLYSRILAWERDNGKNHSVG
jgi:hypothetical protein